METKDDERKKILAVTYTAEEKAEIKEKAKAMGVTMSQYVRFVTLDKFRKEVNK